MHVARSRRLRTAMARAWRPPAYLLGRLPLHGAGVLLVAVPVLAGGLPGLLTVAPPLLLIWIAIAVAASPAERRAVRLLGRPAIADPHAATWDSPRSRLREPATAREASHALASVAIAPLSATLLFVWVAGVAILLAAPFLPNDEQIAAGPWTVSTGPGAWWGVPAGLAWVVAGAAATSALARGHATLAQALLGPRGEELRGQVIELERSRLRLADAFDVERQRIERDLHDGAQQQIVALAVTLDLARLELVGTPQHEAARLVDDAHAQALRTMAELRELIRAVHPLALSERGLGAAVDELADRAPLLVHVTDRLDGQRLAAAVETATYFVISELLANAAKHSGATRVDVVLGLVDSELNVEVRDDGRGGADPATGTGLRGLADRLAPVAGRLTVASPPGGPTIVRVKVSNLPG